jgi:hypothetical protein
LGALTAPHAVTVSGQQLRRAEKGLLGLAAFAAWFRR